MQRGRKREKSRGSVGAGGGRRRNIVQKMLYASIIRGQSCWVVEEELASFVGPLGAAFTSAQWLLPQHGQLERSHQAVDAKPDTHTLMLYSLLPSHSHTIQYGYSMSNERNYIG